MAINPKKSPYHGLWILLIVMVAPPILLTWIFYAVISVFQSRYGFEVNFASAKIFGCGIGALIHFSFWICDAFKDDFRVVKNRLKEFFSMVTISPKLAFTGYFDDIRLCGIVFWIDLAIIALNLLIFADALRDFMAFY